MVPLGSREWTDKPSGDMHDRHTDLDLLFVFVLVLPDDDAIVGDIVGPGDMVGLVVVVVLVLGDNPCPGCGDLSGVGCWNGGDRIGANLNAMME